MSTRKPYAIALVLIAALVSAMPARAATPEPVPADTQPASVAPLNENFPPPQFVQPAPPSQVQPSPAEPKPEADAEPPTAAPPQTEASAQKKSETPRGAMARGIFTTRVANKEPVDDLAELPADTQRIYFFTELHDLSGQTVRHRWERNGIDQGESTFEVRGWHWRVWSLKTIGAREGTWRVTVLNAAGDVIGEKSIQVGATAGQ